MHVNVCMCDYACMARATATRNYVMYVLKMIWTAPRVRVTISQLLEKKINLSHSLQNSVFTLFCRAPKSKHQNIANNTAIFSGRKVSGPSNPLDRDRKAVKSVSKSPFENPDTQAELPSGNRELLRRVPLRWGGSLRKSHPRNMPPYHNPSIILKKGDECSKRRAAIPLQLLGSGWCFGRR